MHNFQSFIKNTRESKELEQKTIADATNLSQETIVLIEQAGDDELLQVSNSILKNQIRRYCEYLEIPEKKIISILNKVDILYYKKSRYGKLKLFDYVNRLAILGLIIAIGLLVTKHVKENIDETSNLAQSDSKSAIIYTPINYQVDNSVNDSDNSQVDTQTSNNTASQDTDNNHKNSNNSNNTDSTKLKPLATKSEKKSMKANPPITANTNNMTFGGIPDDAEAIDLSKN